MTLTDGPPRRLTANLDHVAVAVEHHGDAWPRYIGELGAEWMAAGSGAGFSPAQVRFSGGMRLEALEPHDVEHNDFLRRFLDRNGPGPHHLTFKVDDLDLAIDGARALGIDPVGIDRTDPGWQEAFLHPKQSFGIVVQLAQADHGWNTPPPAGLPVPRPAQPARLTRIVHLVADLAPAIDLFQGLLGGTPDEPTVVSADGGGRAQDMRWPGGGCLRLLQPGAATPEADWLGDRRGRLHHLAFETAAPSELADARPSADAHFEVPPEANHGVRLLVSSSP